MEHVHEGLLLIRVVVGTLMVAHGTQKLFGWSRGYGIAGTGGYFESIGYPRGRAMALVAGSTETGAGASSRSASSRRSRSPASWGWR